VPTVAPAEVSTDVKGDFVLTGLVATSLGLSESDLRAIEVLKVTVEHPKSGPMPVEGVRLSKLLAQVQPAADAKTLVITADDGYSAEAALAEVQACADCIVRSQTPWPVQARVPAQRPLGQKRGEDRAEIIAQRCSLVVALLLGSRMCWQQDGDAAPPCITGANSVVCCGQPDRAIR
jgi:hypothetical protein